MLLTNRTKTGVQKQTYKIVVMNETGTGDTNQFYYTYKYTYDADGKRISAVNGRFVTSYIYNDNTIVAYQLIQENSAIDLFNISYGYGTDGKISSINFTANSPTNNYGYQYQCN